MELVQRLFWPSVISPDQPNAILWALVWHIAPILLGAVFVIWRDRGNPTPYRQQWATMGWLTVAAFVVPVLIFAIASWFQGTMDNDAFSRLKHFVLRPVVEAYMVFPLVYVGAFVASLATGVSRPWRFSGIWLLFLAAYAPFCFIVGIFLACASLNFCL